ncbi:hypothetical protein Hanom_Chr12g01126561 [Helianthus anomalus]
MTTSLVGYAIHVMTHPSAIWSSSRKLCSVWSMVPETSFPTQEEQEPALHEYGRSTPSSSAWSRMKTSSGHSISVFPSGVIRVTLKDAIILTPPRLPLPEFTFRPNRVEVLAVVGW